MCRPALNDRREHGPGRCCGRRWFALLTIVALSCSTSPLHASEYRTPAIKPDALAQLRTSDQHTLVIDLRLPVEYAVAHVPGALNIDPATIEEHLDEIQAADRTVLYCIVGKRTREAEQRLLAHDLSNLYHLDGGFGGWIRSGLPVEKGAAADNSRAGVH